MRLAWQMIYTKQTQQHRGWIEMVTLKKKRDYTLMAHRAPVGI
jgi:hypothetical protein